MRWLMLVQFQQQESIWNTDVRGEYWNSGYQMIYAIAAMQNSEEITCNQFVSFIKLLLPLAFKWACRLQSFKFIKKDSTT